MKIAHKYPPNYKDIVKHFPVVGRSNRAIFTYGDTIFIPSGVSIPPDLIRHEETHQQQQKKMGVKNWWKEYFASKEFRLEQELEAYRNQYQYMKDHYNRKVRRARLADIAEDLSGSLYGNIIKKKEAKRLIITPSEQDDTIQYG